MEKVSVKAVEGRIAFTSPKGGAKIPHDKYIEVQKTPYIDRLIEVHQDIIVEAIDEKPADTSKKKTSALIGD